MNRELCQQLLPYANSLGSCLNFEIIPHHLLFVKFHVDQQCLCWLLTMPTRTIHQCCSSDNKIHSDFLSRSLGKIFHWKMIVLKVILQAAFVALIMVRWKINNFVSSNSKRYYWNLSTLHLLILFFKHRWFAAANALRYHLEDCETSTICGFWTIQRMPSHKPAQSSMTKISEHLRLFLFRNTNFPLIELLPFGETKIKLCNPFLFWDGLYWWAT